MRYIPLWAIFLLILLPAGSGCGQTRYHSRYSDGLESRTTRVSLEQLSERLNLYHAKTTSTHIVLKNALNQVYIFEDPNGRVFVNGVQVGPEGGISKEGGTLYLPEIFEAAIRASLITPQDSPQTREGAGTKHVVVIDPGHGGMDFGTMSALGYSEKGVNLAVALALASRLRSRNIDAYLTREWDVFIDMDERMDLANSKKADLFVGVHTASSTDGAVRGFTIYTRRSPSPASMAAAQSLESAMAVMGIPSRGVREEDFQVLVHAKMPAVLIELGHLSNREDAGLLTRKEFQRSLARSIADGIGRFFDNSNLAL